ncbi:hypothetical protein ABZX75_05025 [Streptomyces sp. NPDC003038]|uniref:hypothetical protein n=1 Tax=unclassified Streptomyces TaxID=2593676 RepID=UPI0033A361A3
MNSGAAAMAVSATACMAVFLNSAPALAGGIGAVGNAAFDNTCIQSGAGPLMDTAPTSGAGLLVGNLHQTPVQYSKNSCGGTDIDVDTTT